MSARELGDYICYAVTGEYTGTGEMAERVVRYRRKISAEKESEDRMKRKHMMKKAMAATMAAAMVLSMTACGSASSSTERMDASAIRENNQASSTVESTTDSQASETSEASATSSTAAETEAKRTQYPVTIKTYGSDGSEIETTYEKAPEKVLAVYQGSVETLLALGLEDHIVATAGLDNEVPDDLKAAFSKTNYLDEFTPSLETVTMLEPDMIFSWGSLFGEKTLGDAKGWVDKGVNIYMNTNTHPKNNDESYSKTLENEYNDILNMGIIFDVQDKAEAIVNEMKNTVASVLDKTSQLEEKPSVMVLETGDDSYTNYGANTLGGDMVTELGGVLANPDASSVGKEDIVDANPDVIFVVYMPYSGDDPEELRTQKLNDILEDEAFASLDAVKNGRVVPIMLSEMYASATRTQDGIETFAKGLYPDIDLQ